MNILLKLAGQEPDALQNVLDWSEKYNVPFVMNVDSEPYAYYNKDAKEIRFSPSLSDPTILAHEVAHHTRNENPSPIWDSFLGTVPAASAILGNLAMLYAPKQYRIPIAIGATGISALAGLPKLLEERATNKDTLKVYPQADKRMLDEMNSANLRSYIANNIIPTAITQGLGLGYAYATGRD